MRILFVSHAALKKELGASKVLIELAEEMEELGWRCQLLSLTDLVSGPLPGGSEIYAEALRDHLRAHAQEFDVVDYDHVYLPYRREEFSSKVLFVARSVLLAHHLLDMRVPVDRTFKATLRRLVLGRRELARLRQIIRRAHETIGAADLINVANSGDEATLVGQGVSKDKIVVLPYGLSRERRILFDAMPLVSPLRAHVVFVGTFDSRKGATDLPDIVCSVIASVPDASFSFLGTFRSREEVLAKFPKAVRSKIQVVPTYSADSLHELLAQGCVGIFPSYMEGFGFGILEMLAAGVPVIAYDVPGPPMMLPPEYLVGVGDRVSMSRKVVALLRAPDELQAARHWAKNRSREFTWSSIAQQTSEAYLAKRAGATFKK